MTPIPPSGQNMELVLDTGLDNVLLVDTNNVVHSANMRDTAGANVGVPVEGVGDVHMILFQAQRGEDMPRRGMDTRSMETKWCAKEAGASSKKYNTPKLLYGMQYSRKRHMGLLEQDVRGPTEDICIDYPRWAVALQGKGGIRSTYDERMENADGVPVVVPDDGARYSWG